MNKMRVPAQKYIPQRPPIVMIDNILVCEDAQFVTDFLIRPDNVFVDDCVFRESGLMKNIAQTCAARVGYYNKYVLHNEVKIGFIGAIKDFAVLRLPAVGETIVTRVDILEEIFGMTLARATVTGNGGETLCRAEIKLSVKDS